MNAYILRVLVIVLLAFGIVVPALAGGGDSAYKLEGAWVAKCVEFPLQWSWVYAPDPSGRRATGHGEFDVGPVTPDLGFGAATGNSHILLEAEMTGPNTVEFSAV